MNGRKVNDIVGDYKAFSQNYFALYLSIKKNKSGKQSLKAMGLLAE